MARNKPIITHTEILCLAIKSIDTDILYYKNKLVQAQSTDADTQKMIEEVCNNMLLGLGGKRNALAEMYRIETGTELN